MTALGSLHPNGIRARTLQGLGDPLGILPMEVDRHPEPSNFLMFLRLRGLGLGARRMGPGRVRAAGSLNAEVANFARVTVCH